MATILVPPGIGDLYWVLTKLESFKKVEGLDSLDLRIFDSGDGSARSLDYAKRHLFLDSVEYTSSDIQLMLYDDPHMKEQFFGDYNTAVIKDFRGFNYLFWLNACMIRGIDLYTVRPEYEVNWYPEMSISHVENEYGRWAKREFGDYILAWFTTRGHYAHWSKLVTFDQWRNMLLEIHKKTGYKILLTGMPWDREDNKNLKGSGNDSIFIDLTGGTTTDQLFGLIKNAKASIGHQAGNMMMSVIFHKPTFIIYNRYQHYPPSATKYWGQFHPDFYKYTLPPNTLNKFQFPIFIDQGCDFKTIINHKVFNQ